MWASRRVRQKENATAFRFISLGSRAGQSRGAAFLKGKAAFAAVLDLMMRKWNRFGGVLVCLLCLYCSELGGSIWQVFADSISALSPFREDWQASLERDHVLLFWIAK
jgi:hypothetical protein